MLDERDWEILNAYADGELEPQDERELTARLNREPALRAALADIQKVKQATIALRAQQAAVKKPVVWPRAIAASLLAVGIFFAGYQILDQKKTWPETLQVAHSELADKTYVIEADTPLPIVSSKIFSDFEAPDLTPSSLFLVDITTDLEGKDQELYLHYRGRHGCSLTLAAQPNVMSQEGGSEALSSEGQLFTWTRKEVRFAVIAQGMDQARFESIAKYIRAVINESMTRNETLRNETLRIAMEESYRAAEPCA